ARRGHGRQGGRAGAALPGHLRREDALLGVRRDVAALDAAAHPRRSDDEHVLEVPRPDELRRRRLRGRVDARGPRRARARSRDARDHVRPGRGGGGALRLPDRAEHPRHGRQVRLHFQLVTLQEIDVAENVTTKPAPRQTPGSFGAYTKSIGDTAKSFFEGMSVTLSYMF